MFLYIMCKTPSALCMILKLTDPFLGSVTSAIVLSMVSLRFAKYLLIFYLLLLFSHLCCIMASTGLTNQFLCLKQWHSLYVGDKFLKVMHCYTSNAFNVLLFIFMQFLFFLLCFVFTGWLHFQTPACFAAEKLKYRECTRDYSFRKTVKEKTNSSCSSTDALNLLADLALSASHDQVPPQPDPALERKPETRLKKCGHTKDVASAEQESVLHALLRQPAARPVEPLESPSPSYLVGDSELVGLISKEHAYSLPSSSPLLLGLLGTPFQVSPLSGSTRLLHHHQQLCGDGIQTLHPSVCQEDRGERNHRTPEYLKKHMVCRRKFRHSRTFGNKDGAVQVTREWNENYDFNRDSKFACDSNDRAIIRALHGYVYCVTYLYKESV